MNKKLIILVGESGAGKSTLCKLIDSKKNWYSSSGIIVHELKKLGLEINHDTIHAFANEAYGENPEWQVPIILDFIDEVGVVILDGPRRLQEVIALKREVEDCEIIKVIANKEVRAERLQYRDGADSEAFKRILKDESQETELSQLLDMADRTIINEGEISDLDIEAIAIREVLGEYSNRGIEKE